MATKSTSYIQIGDIIFLEDDKIASTSGIGGVQADGAACGSLLQFLLRKLPDPAAQSGGEANFQRRC